jgi:Trk K+ transport system NAD-binding subunit
MHTVFIDSEYDISEFRLERPHIESIDAFEKDFSCKVILVKRNGDKILTNRAVQLQSGDTIVCVYPSSAREKLFRAFNREE